MSDSMYVKDTKLKLQSSEVLCSSYIYMNRVNMWLYHEFVSTVTQNIIPVTVGLFVWDSWQFFIVNSATLW